MKQKQQVLDVKNLRFYAQMAKEYHWCTDIIHESVITQTLNEIADRLDTVATVVQCSDCGREDVSVCLRCGHQLPATSNQVADLALSKDKKYTKIIKPRRK